MPTVIVVTEELKDQLQDQTCNGGLDTMNFAQDGSTPPNWVCNAVVLEDENFKCFWGVLADCEQIEWVPPVFDEEL